MLLIPTIWIIDFYLNSPVRKPKDMRPFFLLLSLLILSASVYSQSGHSIKVNIDGYEEDVLYLAYHYGDKQYVKDTAHRQSDDSFVFQGSDPLDPGSYMLVMPPENQSFEFLIDKNEQHFELSMEKARPLETVRLTYSSGENKLFFEYLQFLASMRKKAEALQGENSETSKTKLDNLNAEVRSYQEKLISQNPKSLTAAIVKAYLPLDYPEMEGTEDEIQTSQWRYAQQHFFDNIDLADTRLLRTSLLFDKVNYFIEKLQIQQPDTVSLAIDEVLTQMAPSEENYKYYVIHFLNKYAKSKIIGMDAVYVHMVENYYAGGKAPWTEPEQLQKILDNAARLKPLLLGKTAPNVSLQNRSGLKFNLHDVEATYTVLYFWRYDCDQCKKTTPGLREFYEEYKNQGVKIVAICTKPANELEGCWNYVDEQKLNGWIQASNANGQTMATAAYDIRSTPQIYLLDKDKKIISKRLTAYQLAEVLEQHKER